MTTLCVKISLEERIKSLHADKYLELIQVSHILEGHYRESHSIIITNSLVKEESFNSKGQGIERDFSCGWGDDIKHHVLVVEVDVSISCCNSLIDCKWKGNVNSLLV